MAKLNRLEYDGVSHQPWSEPTLADLTSGHTGMSETSEWDDLTRGQKRHIRHHFLVTVGETDSDGLPETFGQLKLPVVTPNHKLSKQAVDNADARLGQVESLGDVESDARTRLTNLQENELGE
ncbi:hypothetical protein ACFQE8_21225 [Salinirubellus sp. GCM10025818]|uniref:hypothetical protein n=1 Tax=Salinirubellus TaxID=2162630 RepID=UPI0030CE2A32